MADYRDEIECDLAETYHIYNMAELPLDVVARLIFGLRDNSRFKMKYNKMLFNTSELLLARILDCLNIMIWQRSKSGTKFPDSVYEKMVGVKQEKKRKNVTFSSMEEFEKARQKIIEGSKT